MHTGANWFPYSPASFHAVVALSSGVIPHTSVIQAQGENVALASALAHLTGRAQGQQVTTLPPREGVNDGTIITIFI